MPAKLILTGHSVGNLRKLQNNIFSFDMKEDGSKIPPPKGFDFSEPILYTVFLNLRQLNKAKLNHNNLSQHRLHLEGDITLSYPISICPGEIGVICRKIEIISDESEKECIKEIVGETKEDRILVNEIKIPDDFKKFEPKKEKIDNKVEYYVKNGHFDKPVTINKETKLLVDGYTIYLAALEKKVSELLCVYV